jgi:hypothetical protein
LEFFRHRSYAAAISAFASSRVSAMPPFWWWCSHHLQEPTPFRARRHLFQIHAPDAGLVVEDGVVGVFPSERFPPLDPILRVLLAEEIRTNYT